MKKLRTLDRNNFTPVEVDATAGSFLLEQTGRLCAPGQDIREFTVNGIQAIQRAQDKIAAGEYSYMSADRDWLVKVAESPYHPNKVAYMDNGESMDEETLKESFKVFKRNLGRTQKNFGIGGKAAGLANSPFGIEYLCWRNYKGVRGLLFVADEEVGFIVEDLDLSVSPPDWFEGTGTVVVPLGHSADENTVATSPFEEKSGWSTGGNSRLRYLNEKLWTVPANIEVRARNFQEKSIIVDRPVRGYMYFLNLESVKQHSGILSFPKYGVEVEWYIVSEGGKDKNKGRGIAEGGQDSKGRVAVVYEDEVYQIRKSSDGHMHTRFGIWAAQSRVHMYVRPVDTRYAPDPARRTIIDDETMDAIGAEFKAQLPAEIKALLKANSTPPKVADDYPEQLRRWHAFHGDAYHKCKLGIRSLTEGDEPLEPAGDPRGPNDPDPNPDPGNSGIMRKHKDPERGGEKDGSKGVARGIGKLPHIEVQWSDTPVAHDDENLFAAFDLEHKTLTVYNGWTELEKWTAAYERNVDVSLKTDGEKRQAVTESFKVHLVEVLKDVLLSRMEALKRGHLDDEQFKSATNEYALTTVASQRIAPLQVVQRKISGKWGKKDEAAIAAAGE